MKKLKKTVTIMIIIDNIIDIDIDNILLIIIREKNSMTSKQIKKGSLR